MDEKIGLFPMVGDLLHPGHLKALEEAKKYCTKLIVALNVDPTIDNKDKEKPIETVYERYVRLQSCKYVDEIIPYIGEKDLELLIRTTDYNIRFIGADHKEHWTGKEYEDEHNINAIVLSRDHNLSSTLLRNRLNDCRD